MHNRRLIKGFTGYIKLQWRVLVFRWQADILSVSLSVPLIWSRIWPYPWSKGGGVSYTRQSCDLFVNCKLILQVFGQFSFNLDVSECRSHFHLCSAKYFYACRKIKVYVSCCIWQQQVTRAFFCTRPTAINMKTITNRENQMVYYLKPLSQ